VAAPAVGKTVVALASEPDLAAWAALGQDSIRSIGFCHGEFDRIPGEVAKRDDARAEGRLLPAVAECGSTSFAQFSSLSRVPQRFA
jgi:hypothetical protein